MDLREGSIVYSLGQTRYKVEKFIDRGQFGDVFLIRPEVDAAGEAYALKTISTSFLNGAEFDALLNEGRLAPQVDHQNVIRVHYFHDGNEHSDLPPAARATRSATTVCPSC